MNSSCSSTNIDTTFEDADYMDITLTPPDPYSPSDNECDPEYLQESSPPKKAKSLLSFFTRTVRGPHATTASHCQEEEDNSLASTSSGTSVSDAAAPTSNLPILTPTQTALLDGTYFEIKQSRPKGNGSADIVVLCKMCRPAEKNIKGNSGSTSNFLKHFKTKHHTMIKEYLEYKKIKTSKESKKKREEILHNKKQMNIKESFSRPKSISQEEFDNRLISFIASTMSPISIVENPTFIHLFDMNAH